RQFRSRRPPSSLELPCARRCSPHPARPTSVFVGPPSSLPGNATHHATRQGIVQFFRKARGKSSILGGARGAFHPGPPSFTEKTLRCPRIHADLRSLQCFLPSPLRLFSRLQQ